MSTKGKVVQGISQEQRYYLCLKKVECPDMKQSELAEWFKNKYGRAISQPTISHTLKRKSEVLERGLNTPGMYGGGAKFRNRNVKHPQFERSLYEWICSLPVGEADGLTGPQIIERAKQLSEEMQLENPQVYCNGWLSRFRARYNIRHGRRRDDTNESSGAEGGGLRRASPSTNGRTGNSSNNDTNDHTANSQTDHNHAHTNMINDNIGSSSSSASSSTLLVVPDQQHSTVVAAALRRPPSPSAEDLSLASRSLEAVVVAADGLASSSSEGTRAKRQKTARHGPPTQQPLPPTPQDTTPSSLLTMPSSSSVAVESIAGTTAATPAEALAVSHHTTYHHLDIQTVAAAAAAAAAASEATSSSSSSRSSSYPVTTVTTEPSNDNGRTASQLQYESQLHMELLRSLPLDPAPPSNNAEGKKEGGEGDQDTTTTAAVLSSSATTASATSTTTWPHTTLDDDSILAQIAARTRVHGHDQASPSPSPLTAATAAVAPTATTGATVNGGSGSSTTVSTGDTDGELVTSHGRGGAFDQHVPVATAGKEGKYTAEDARAWLSSIRAFVYQQHQVLLPSSPSATGEVKATSSRFNPDKAYHLLAELQEVLDI